MNTIITARYKTNGKWEEIEVEFEDTDGNKVFECLSGFFNGERRQFSGQLNLKEYLEEWERVGAFYRGLKDIIEKETGHSIESVEIWYAKNTN